MVFKHTQDDAMLKRKTNFAPVRLKDMDIKPYINKKRVNKCIQLIHCNQEKAISQSRLLYRQIHRIVLTNALFGIKYLSIFHIALRLNPMHTPYILLLLCSSCNHVAVFLEIIGTASSSMRLLMLCF